MISHSIIKRPPPSYNYVTQYQKPEVQRLTQEELNDYLKTVQFKPGDLIYYSGILSGHTKLERPYQLNLVKEVITDASKVTYDTYQKLPEVLLLLAIGNAVTNPDMSPYERKEHIRGWCKVSKEQYSQVMNDSIHDYLKTNNISFNIPQE